MTIGTKTSAKTTREHRYELMLQQASLDAVFAASSGSEFQKFMNLTVYKEEHFDKLPQYRQLCIRAYALGALHAKAKMLGAAVNIVPPKPKRGRPRKNDFVPVNIPPVYKSPFPPAADLGVFAP